MNRLFKNFRERQDAQKLADLNAAAAAPSEPDSTEL
jgi:hypothetical protein